MRANKCVSITDDNSLESSILFYEIEKYCFFVFVSITYLEFILYLEMWW